MKQISFYFDQLNWIKINVKKHLYLNQFVLLKDFANHFLVNNFFCIRKRCLKFDKSLPKPLEYFWARKKLLLIEQTNYFVKQLYISLSNKEFLVWM